MQKKIKSRITVRKTSEILLVSKSMFHIRFDSIDIDASIDGSSKIEILTVSQITNRGLQDPNNSARGAHAIYLTFETFLSIPCLPILPPRNCSSSLFSTSSISICFIPFPSLFSFSSSLSPLLFPFHFFLLFFLFLLFSLLYLFSEDKFKRALATREKLVYPMFKFLI